MPHWELGLPETPQYWLYMFMLIAARVVAAGTSFTCTPTAVWDGDGPIWCAEGPKIRLAGIAAKEMDGSCKPGHPCPAASPIAARDQLVRFLGGPRGTMRTGHIRVSAAPMRCISDGSANGDRTAGWCSMANGVDLNCAMVRSGVAARWDRYWRGHRC
jgi:endonuclease YncB( thermonuclease family)